MRACHCAPHHLAFNLAFRLEFRRDRLVVGYYELSAWREGSIRSCLRVRIRYSVVREFEGPSREKLGQGRENTGRRKRTVEDMGCTDRAEVFRMVRSGGGDYGGGTSELGNLNGCNRPVESSAGKSKKQLMHRAYRTAQPKRSLL